MWGVVLGREARVTCIACGATIARSNAREYDKEGNRWDRSGKEFEYLCKPCHRDINHHPREELESLLLEIEQGSLSQTEFVRAYTRLVEQRDERSRS